MARIRSLKPEFWGDQDLAEQASRDARLLYTGLWNLADEHSRLRGDPRYLKGQLFPYDDDLEPVHIAKLLAELVAARKVLHYEVQGCAYLFLPNLSKHQRLEPDKVASRLPEPPAPVPAPESESRSGSSERRADEHEPGAKDHALSMLHVAGGMEHVAGSMSGARAARTDAAAARIVLERLDDATQAEADAVVAIVRQQRKPRNLPGLLKKIADAGELPGLLEQVRTDTRRLEVRAVMAAARDGPACPHGVAGGDALHPESQQPLCPKCRSEELSPA
jgi:hypothetical protein